jgi:hypothetical protein
MFLAWKMAILLFSSSNLRFPLASVKMFFTECLCPQYTCQNQFRLLFFTVQEICLCLRKLKVRACASYGHILPFYLSSCTFKCLRLNKVFILSCLNLQQDPPLYNISYLRIYPCALRLYHPEALLYSLT